MKIGLKIEACFAITRRWIAKKSPKTLFQQLERYLNEIPNEIQYYEPEPLSGCIFGQPYEVKIVNFLGLTKFEYSKVAGIAELLNFRRYVK